MNSNEFEVTENQIRRMFEDSYGPIDVQGWHPRLRWLYNYFTPDEWYQTLIDNLVTSECVWLDVGGGKSVFHNPGLETKLSSQCKKLVSLDPSDNIQENDVVHERLQCMIEDLDNKTEHHERYSLATLRMVAEHIEEPDEALSTLSKILIPGGHVVLLTPWKYSPNTLVSRIVPDSLHWIFTRLLTPDRLEEDVFPTAYRLNTRHDLRCHFNTAGFDEVGFLMLPDCGLFHRYKFLSRIEIGAGALFRKFRFRYPESNILGVYKKRNESAAN
ncbi:methyltransferase domain-containing protein [Rhodopirellula sallentina]|uniref:methyltransferase domain-containing protein n=1 Tax=Rhodopirellula sallentina TaxID=1263869 RepID=UPI0009D9D6AB|nr:methyltransferase domain-containing protein [Rhodopirellula sallentina]